MEYIHFYHPLTDSMRDGFLLGEDGHLFFVADPILVEWLTKIERLDLLERIRVPSFSKALSPYRVIPLRREEPFIGAYDFLYDFPFTEEDIPHLPALAVFFEWFLEARKLPLASALGQAKQYTKGLLPDSHARRLAEFILSHKHSPRGQLLFHPSRRG